MGPLSGPFSTGGVSRVTPAFALAVTSAIAMATCLWLNARGLAKVGSAASGKSWNRFDRSILTELVRTAGRPLSSVNLIVFTAAACEPCQLLSTALCSRAAPVSLSPVFVSAESRLTAQLKVDAFPKIVLLAKDGRVLREWTGYSERLVEDLAASVRV